LLARAGAVLLFAALALGSAWLLAERVQSTAPVADPAPPVSLPLPAWTFEEVSDWPQSPQPEVLYVGIPAGEAAPVAAMLLCPCGCGDIVRISLREQDDPHWYFSADEAGRPTLVPSIWRGSGCESHFTLTGGRLAMIPVELPAIE
jgi:hypothetical protein